jgi:carbamoyltransferase
VNLLRHLENIMRVLGISALFHDSAAAIVVDGALVAAAAEERFSRTKGDARLPEEAVKFCLRQAGLASIDMVDAVVFYEKPVKKFERILTHQLATFPFGAKQTVRALSLWLRERLFTKSALSVSLGVAPEKIFFVEHHLAHAASAFLPSGFGEAAVLTVDGVGEDACTTIWNATHDDDGRPRLTPLLSERFPHSIGLFYSAMTAYLGFTVNEGEYKVMGLAAYGTPRFKDTLAQIARVHDDGTFALDLSCFRFHLDDETSFSPALCERLGRARDPSSTIDLASTEGQRFADIAASVQAVTEDAVLALARRAHSITRHARLCLAGGVAQNVVANRRLAEEGPFQELYVPHAPGDAGGAIGAALYVSRRHFGAPHVVDPGPFIGAPIDDDASARFLSDVGVPFMTLDDDDLAREIAMRVARGEVGALATGRFEWGQRALGARSIIADPRSSTMQTRVNESVKRREAFRPFAPSLLACEFTRFFDAGRGADHALHRGMLSVVRATDEGVRALPAVVHKDGTSRVHIVDDASSLLHRVLTAFKAETGVGVLLQTSMNLKDEPAVADAADALVFFLRSDVDFLVVGRALVVRDEVRARAAALLRRATTRSGVGNASTLVNSRHAALAAGRIS